MLRTIVLTLSVSLVTGCSTLKDSTLLGVGIGSVVGAGVGAAAGSPRRDDNRGAVAGAAVGAALGGLMGYLDYRERAKKEALRIGAEFGSSNSESPLLTKPKVLRVWVPEKVEGDKYISGHWMYVIERPSVWSKD